MTVIKPLGAATVVPMLDLRVRPDQDSLVAPNNVTLAQALFEGGSEVFGIYDADIPVGLMAVIDFAHPDASLGPQDDPNTLYIWRLMIDAAHQHKGHGQMALTFAKDLAQRRGRSNVTLTIVDAPNTALAFYEAAGFSKTGRIIKGEIELALHATTDKTDP